MLFLVTAMSTKVSIYRISQNLIEQDFVNAWATLAHRDSALYAISVRRHRTFPNFAKSSSAHDALSGTIALLTLDSDRADPVIAHNGETLYHGSRIRKCPVFTHMRAVLSPHKFMPMHGFVSPSRNYSQLDSAQ